MRGSTTSASGPAVNAPPSAAVAPPAKTGDAAPRANGMLAAERPFVKPIRHRLPGGSVPFTGAMVVLNGLWYKLLGKNSILYNF